MRPPFDVQAEKLGNWAMSTMRRRSVVVAAGVSCGIVVMAVGSVTVGFMLVVCGRGRKVGKGTCRSWASWFAVAFVVREWQ
jgi:hypothetical protein